jgi:hypothetical protein
MKELQANIKHDISSIPIHQLRRMTRNIFLLCEVCLEAEGSHFETLV